MLTINLFDYMNRQKMSQFREFLKVMLAFSIAWTASLMVGFLIGGTALLLTNEKIISTNTNQLDHRDYKPTFCTLESMKFSQEEQIANQNLIKSLGMIITFVLLSSS